MQPASSFDSVRIISLDRNDLLAQLGETALRLRTERPEVSQVRLFGSLARGDQTGVSDVDVLILLDQTSESDTHRRILTYLPYFDLDRGVDLLVYTRAEFERFSAHNPFLRHIWQESIIL